MEPTDEDADGRDLKTRMDEYERGLIMAALGAADGQQSRAAALLGVLPTTLHEKIKRLGLHRTFGSDPLPGAREVRLEETGGTFRWRGPLAPGATVELRGTIGHVSVRGTPQEFAEILALASGQGEAHAAVHVLEHAGGLVVSARHHKPETREDTGGRERAASLLVRVRVDFDVQVPASAHLHVRLYGGDVTILGVEGHVEAHTTSGTVRIA